MNFDDALLLTMGETDMPYFNFETLPETEAGADATHFVVEMAGGSNANETGVGGGLTGANLDLARFGTVGASSSGWRALSAQSGFGVTDTFVDTFLRNAAGFALLYHLKDFNFASPVRVLTMQGTSPAFFQIDIIGGAGTSLVAGCAEKWGIQFYDYQGAANDVFPASGEAYLLLSVDFTSELQFLGVSNGTVQPTKIDDFKIAAYGKRTIAPAASAMSCTAGLNNIIGVNSGIYTSAPFSIKSITAMLGPSVTIA